MSLSAVLDGAELHEFPECSLQNGELGQKCCIRFRYLNIAS